MDADWDLQAVVRGCCSAVSSATTTAPAWPVEQNSTFKGFFPDLFQPRTHNSIEHLLTDLYNPPPPSPQSLPISPLSVLAGLQDPPHHHHHHQPKQFQGIRQQPLGISRCTTSHAPKFKKRKNQIKKVCQVPAEGSSSDLWSWRKYGQKPIKGSPYPRGYYKCSTSKGCLARKQVERNRSDPGMLIITYTGEHSHPAPTQRNTLAAGKKLTTSTSSGDDNRPTPPLSPATEKMDENDTDDDNNFEAIFD